MRATPHAAGGVTTKALLVAMLCLAASAETIDRIAVAVGNRVVTVSDIDRQSRLSAFQSGTKPEVGASARRKIAESMVDQMLVRRELETARYPEPDAAEVEALLKNFKDEQYSSDADYRRALTEYGLTETDLKEQLLWQRRFLSFISVRFRPAVQVSDQEVRDYFEKTVLPAAQVANPDAKFTLEEFRDRILSKLTGDRVDQATETWLAEVRGRTEIVFHEEAFQ